jgi:hypothetical protein
MPFCSRKVSGSRPLPSEPDAAALAFPPQPARTIPEPASTGRALKVELGTRLTPV